MCQHYNKCSQYPLSLFKLGAVAFTITSLLMLAGCANQPTSDYKYNQIKKPNQNHARQQIRYNARGVPNYYQVRSGDTLSSIARRFGLNYRQIGVMNGLTNFNNIHVGQWLKLWQNEQRVSVSDSHPNNSNHHHQNLPTSELPKPVSPTQTPQPGYPQFGHKPVTNDEKYLATVYETLTFIYPTSNGIWKNFDRYKKGGSETMWFYGNDGDPVYASQDGQVSVSGNDGANWGNVVILQHADGYATRYGHNSRLLVQKGQFVRKGDVIAYMGSTGNTNQVALEFQLLQYNKPIDPKVMLNKNY